MHKNVESLASTKKKPSLQENLQEIYLKNAKVIVDDDLAWYKNIIVNSGMQDYHEDMSDCFVDVLLHLSKDNQHLATGHSIDDISANFGIIIELLREIRNKQNERKDAILVVDTLLPFVNQNKLK